MSPLAVAGKVLDASAAAGGLGLTLLVPELAVTEVLTLRPDQQNTVEDLLAHPQVLLDRLTQPDRRHLDELLEHAAVFDVCAGWTVQRARDRGWSAVSADPPRLHHVDALLDVDPV